MGDKSSTIFWKDEDGCHWCLRKATSITEGHDGMCPVPYATQLEADRDEYRNLYHLAEAKISSREAIIESLSETELAKDVTRLEAELEKIICHWCEAEVTEDEANEHYKSCTKNPLRAENEDLKVAGQELASRVEQFASEWSRDAWPFLDLAVSKMNVALLKETD